jgi:hypothetical protein
MDSAMRYEVVRARIAALKVSEISDGGLSDAAECLTREECLVSGDDDIRKREKLFECLIGERLI